MSKENSLVREDIFVLASNFIALRYAEVKQNFLLTFCLTLKVFLLILKKLKTEKRLAAYYSLFIYRYDNHTLVFVPMVRVF